MKTLKVLIGIQGSGKSTYVSLLMNKENSCCVNKDLIRASLSPTGEWSHEIESQVNFIEHEAIMNYIELGKDLIVIDATNLSVPESVIRNFFNTFVHILPSLIKRKYQFKLVDSEGVNVNP